MQHNYREFDDALTTRRQTLAMVADLTQEKSEHRVRSGVWSVGEVLDHLIRLDELMSRELQIAIDRGNRGLPLVYRSMAAVDKEMVPALVRPVMPFFEVPFSIVNTLVPQPIRRAVTGNRRVPARAPKILEPRRGRDVSQMRRELIEVFDTFRRQQEASKRDLEQIYYYNPITGLNTLPGMYKFTANHERRHQGQLREILADGYFSAADLAGSEVAVG